MASSLLTTLLIAIATAQVALAIYYPKCGAPHRPDNGGYNPINDKYAVGSKINFFCKTGYRLHGSSSTICKHKLKKSYWSHESPVCKRITCQDLDDPTYGRVNVTGYTPGYKAHYKCDYGYKLVGEAYRECLHTGYWGGEEPVCELITCQNLYNPTYGRVNVTGYTPGYKAHYKCDYGYKLVGEAYRECLYTGYWGGEEPVCELITCQDLYDPTYGRVNVTGYTPGYKAHYKCDYGYKLIGEAYRECLYSGYWGGEEPVCERIRCLGLNDPTYGKVNVTGNTPGYKAHYKCDYGYKLVGEAYRECLYSGYWGGEEPVCERITCLQLEAPLHGKVVVKGNTPSSKALYSCNHGYKLHGLEERQCQYDGTWQGDAPVCKKILCPPLKAPVHGKVIISGYTPLSKALYSCKKGYKLVGLLLRKCLANGSWFGSAPTCQLLKH